MARGLLCVGAVTRSDPADDGCLFPVQLDSETKRRRVGFCQRAGESVLVVTTPSQFAVGDELDVLLLLSAEERVTVRGTVTSTRHLEGVGPFCRQVSIDVGAVPARARGRRVDAPPAAERRDPQ